MSGIAQLQQYQDLEAMRQGEPMPVTMTPEARELAPQVAQGVAEAALMFAPGSSVPDAMGLQPDPLSDEYYPSMWENLRQGEYTDAALQGVGMGADLLSAIGAGATATGVGAPAGMAAMGAGVGLSGLSTAWLASRRANRASPSRQENLMRWFGNSVVAEDGKPKVLYHGTLQDFDTFRRGDIGYHFGSREQAENRVKFLQKYGGEGSGAEGFGPGDFVMPVHLRVENPLRMEDVGEWGDPFEVYQQLPDEILSRVNPKLVDQVLDIRKQYYGAENQFGNLPNEYFTDPKTRKALDTLRAAIKDSGYDGIVYANRGEGAGDSYIVFEPEQAKSAIGNTGRFDPRNPAITAGVGALAVGTGYSMTEEARQDMENMKDDLRAYLRNTPAE